MTTTDPQSDFTETVHGVYVIVTILASIVFVVVLATILALAIVFRERPGREARQFHGNTRLEIIWTIIPVAIVAIIAVPTFFAIADTTNPPPEDAITIEVTGHQWWFEFNYVDEGLITGNEIHIPTGQPVSFVLESADVIHSFWIPQLVGKMDLVPGHTTGLWFTANDDAARSEAYLGQCAEFCNHPHEVTVNGAVLPLYDFPEAGTEDLCMPEMANGMVPSATAGRTRWVSASRAASHSRVRSPSRT